MKAFKKVLAVSFAAAAILGMAASASAAKPKTPKQVTVMLYKEKKSAPSNRWIADEATTFIPIKRLKWDAQICEISSNNKKTFVEPRCVGAYELNICKGPYTQPGNTSVVRFIIKQDGDVFLRKVKVVYMAAINPLKVFTIEGTYKDENDATKNFSKSFVSSFANSGATLRTVDWTRKCFIKEAKITVGIDTKYYKDVKLVGCLNCGKEILLYNGNKVDLTTLCAIRIEYKTSADLWKVFSKEKNKGWDYYKAPNDSFRGTKRFDNTKSLVLNIK